MGTFPQVVNWVFVAASLPVWIFAGVGIYLGSQSTKRVIITDKQKFWLRLIGTLILSSQILAWVLKSWLLL